MLSSSVDLFIGDRILHFRKKRGLSQEDLAKTLNISRQQLQKYETGITRVPISVIAEISRAIGVKAVELMAGIDEVNAPQPLPSNGFVTINRSHPLHILLVEDNATDELLTRKAIEQCEEACLITSAGDGLAALDFLRNSIRGLTPQSAPDIVFLDLNIPKMRGDETLKSIKTNPAIQHIPVVVITNSINRDEMLRVYKLGASGFVVKSFSPEEYFEKISNIVSYWSAMVLPSM